jgi:long-chain acyl-CoA synthetase
VSELQSMSQGALAGDPSRPAIEFEGRWLNRGQLCRVANSVAELIEASGPGRHGRIAFVARNRPADLAAFLGMLAMGCRVRMVYPFQSPRAIAREIERIQPTVMLAAREDYSTSVFDVLRECGAAAIALEGLTASSPGGLELCRRVPVGEATPEVEVLTSGTTGPPKAFALSYNMIARYIAGASTVQHSLTQDRSTPCPPLLYFPVSNISGLHSVLPPMLNNQPIVLLERFTVAGWHDHLLRYKPPFGGLPPAGIQMVLDANIPPADLACLRATGFRRALWRTHPALLRGH